MNKPAVITLIAGTRPNYMKVAPLWKALRAEPGKFKPVLVHTGQHYDNTMSGVFFRELGLPEPDVSLNVGSGSHAEQTGRAMIAIEQFLAADRPDMLVVVGDVNSTIAGALAAVKLGIRVAHIEAGLRSFDMTMPEEINRVATDAISDILFTSCRDADSNLLKQGIPAGKIHFVGNIMIDSLTSILPLAAKSGVLEKHGLKAGSYVCVTLHRPSNVDDPVRLPAILDALSESAGEIPVIFPVHPRTRARITELGNRIRIQANMQMCDPMGYLDFVQLMSHAAVVLTDSGGIQEETSYLGIPCLTLRENTERPITITHGTNRLIRPSSDDIVGEIRNGIKSAAEPFTRHAPIELWDGHTAGRIVKILAAEMEWDTPSAGL